MLTHYDLKMSRLEADLLEVRKQSHAFRDELKAELAGLSRYTSAVDDRIGKESEKANERFNHDHHTLQKLQTAQAELDKHF